MFSDSDFTWMVIKFAVVCGLLGWGLIEGFIWLFNNINFGIN
jgi:hypothetical protein